MATLNKKGSFLVFSIVIVLILVGIFFAQEIALENSRKKRKEQITIFKKDFVKELSESVIEGNVPITPQQKIAIEEIGIDKKDTITISKLRREALETMLGEMGIHPGIMSNKNIPNFKNIVYCNDSVAEMEHLAQLYEEDGNIQKARNWRVVLAYFYEMGWDYCEEDRSYNRLSSLIRSRDYYEDALWTYAVRRVNKKIEEFKLIE